MPVSWVRTLFFALLAAVPPAAFTLAAAAPAFAGPCPIHAGPIQPAESASVDHGSHAAPAERAASDHRHHEGQAAPAVPDEGPVHPLAFGLACCATHVVGVFAPAFQSVPAGTSAVPIASRDHALLPGLLSGVDPPPRLP